METKEAMTIPYVVYESLLDKTDLQHKRMTGIIILLVILLVASNLVWLYAWNQYDYVEGEVYEIEASQDGEGVNILGAGGDVEYGADS